MIQNYYYWYCLTPDCIPVRSAPDVFQKSGMTHCDLLAHWKYVGTKCVLIL